MAFKKKSLGMIAGLVVALLLFVALYFFLRRREGREGFESQTTVTYYYLPECPWCKKFKPEWDKFSELAKKLGIDVSEVDASDATHAEATAKKGIRGFPTVIVSKGGQDEEYGGDRTADDLMKFVMGSK
jgi:glutaredoxin